MLTTAEAPTHAADSEYLMANSGLLCKRAERYDYRAEWMRQGLVIPLSPIERPAEMKTVLE
jgi:hypothetical protein